MDTQKQKRGKLFITAKHFEVRLSEERGAGSLDLDELSEYEGGGCVVRIDVRCKGVLKAFGGHIFEHKRLQTHIQTGFVLRVPPCDEVMQNRETVFVDLQQ